MTKVAKIPKTEKTKTEKTKTVKRVTITVCGNTDDDADLALDEVFRLLKDGYTSGHNGNESGAFYFSTTTDVSKKDYPAT